MKVSMDLCLMQSIEMTQSIRESIGEYSGDIPMYSMHRISNLLQNCPIAISKQFNEILKKQLIAANVIYREESGNQWNCLTSLNLVFAIEGADKQVREFTHSSEIPNQYSREEVIKVFDRYRIRAITTIKSWFEENFNDLLYNMDGKIPWAIVQRLRKDLGRWISDASKPFHQNIEDMILDVAKENCIYTDNPEDAWESMGGTVFK